MLTQCPQCRTQYRLRELPGHRHIRCKLCATAFAPQSVPATLDDADDSSSCDPDDVGVDDDLDVDDGSSASGVDDSDLPSTEVIGKQSLATRGVFALVAITAVIGIVMVGRVPLSGDIDEAATDSQQQERPRFGEDAGAAGSFDHVTHAEPASPGHGGTLNDSDDVITGTEAKPLPRAALDEQVRRDDLFDRVAQRYSCEVRLQANTQLPEMMWIEFVSGLGNAVGSDAESADPADQADQTVTITVPDDMVRVWSLFDELRIHGPLANDARSRIHLTGPHGRTPIDAHRDGNRLLVANLKRLPIDAQSGTHYSIEYTGAGRIERLGLASRHGVSRSIDLNPWTTPGGDRPVKPITVSVDATRHRTIDGHGQLERERYWRIASDYGNHPDAIIGAEYAAKRGFKPGRGILKLDGLQQWGIQGHKLTEDLDHPGQPDDSIFDKVRRDDRAIQQLDAVFGPPFDYAMCFDNWPDFMSLKNTRVANDRGTPANFQSAAELASRVIAARNTERNRPARWWEVKNEATIVEEWVLHAEPGVDSWAKLADFHNTMADTIHRDHPDIEVGGPTSAWMALDHSGFALARRQMQFMDDTQDHLDFYSHHFYEGSDLVLTDGPEFSGGYLTGRLEGCLDLLRNHGAITGNIKPFLITEYGSLYGGASDLHQWVNIKNYNGYLIRFMNLPDAIPLTNAFIIPVKHWDKSGEDALFRYDGSGRLVLNNKLHHYFDLWHDYCGQRITNQCLTADAFLPMHSVIDDRTVRIVMHNLNPFRIAASIELNSGDAVVQRIEQTRLYFDRGELIFKSETVDSLQSLPVAVEETTLITVTLDRPVTPSHNIDEQTLFGDRIIQPTGTPAEFFVDCPSAADAHVALDRVRLRVCIARKNGFEHPVTITVNEHELPGSPVEVTPDRKSGRYWGFVELDVPVHWIEESNAISVSSPESGGFVSSVVLIPHVIRDVSASATSADSPAHE